MNGGIKMALIECKECQKTYSDSLESCPHCGFKKEGTETVTKESKNVQEQNSKVEEYMKKFLADKKSVFSFICGIISLICSFIFLTEMNLSGIPYVFTLCLVATSAINILYSLKVIKKYNNDMLLGGIALTGIGFLLRTFQLGIIPSWQYFVAYYIFTLIMILLIYKFTQNKGNDKFLNALLIIAAVYDIYEFISSGNNIIKGIYWRIYHIAEAALFINYVGILNINKGKYEEFGKSLGKYKTQIFSQKIAIAIFSFIAIIAMIIGGIKQINNDSNSIISNNSSDTGILSSFNNSSTAKQENVAAKAEKEKQDYINNSFKLLGANVKYFEKSYSEDEWGLENIEVKNYGNKDIKSFEITVYFKDSAGNNIGENNFSIYETIKANYSWKQRTSSYYELENLAGEIDPTKNEIKITDVEFITTADTISEEKQNYINNNFNLLGANIKYFEKSYSEDEWGLENIEVKNTGDKNVKSFEITVYFKDTEGNNIAENTFNLYESIKANYSWKQRSSSYYELENLAGEVDPSRHEIKITDIEFEA